MKTKTKKLTTKLVSMHAEDSNIDYTLLNMSPEEHLLIMWPLARAAYAFTKIENARSKTRFFLKHKKKRPKTK